MTSIKPSAHANMVWQQLRPNDISDPQVLQVLQDSDRGQFVAPELQALAYADTQLPIGCDQYMLSPLQEARMLQALQLSPTDNVLEIGTGSGFFTAMLAQIAARIITVEWFKTLSDGAEARLNNLGLQDKITFCIGDARQGWPVNERQDAIILTAACPAVPESYLHALRVGGRLLVIVGEKPAMQVQRITRNGEKQWQTETVFETVVPHMIGAEPKPEFAF